MLVPTQVTTQATLPAAATWRECLCQVGHGATARGGTTDAQTRQRSPDRPAGSGADGCDPPWASDRESDQHQADDDPMNSLASQNTMRSTSDSPAATIVIHGQEAASPGTPHSANADAPNAATTAAIRTYATGRRAASGSNHDESSENAWLGSSASGAMNSRWTKPWATSRTPATMRRRIATSDAPWRYAGVVRDSGEGHQGQGGEREEEAVNEQARSPHAEQAGQGHRAEHQESGVEQADPEHQRPHRGQHPLEATGELP